MRRFLLLHEGQRILLPPGRTLLGRGLGCKIRFNDPAVSREHLAIDVKEGNAVVSNLSANGTLYNGARLILPHALGDNDELKLGFRKILVEVVESPDASDKPVSLGGPRGREALPIDEDQLAEEHTRPGEEGWRKRVDNFQPNEPILAKELSPSRLSQIQSHTCPRCRTKTPYDDEACKQCGYLWPTNHPSRTTQEISIEKVLQRADPRYAVEVPVIYSSSTLTIDAIVRDLSKGGMFVETELLDPVGTPCDLTVLPDGYGALQFRGTVAHVANATEGARNSGLGIRFLSNSKEEEEAARWLDRVLATYETAVLD